MNLKELITKGGKVVDLSKYLKHTRLYLITDPNDHPEYFRTGVKPRVIEGESIMRIEEGYPPGRCDILIKDRGIWNVMESQIEIDDEIATTILNSRLNNQ